MSTVWTRFDIVSVRTADSIEGQRKYVLYSIRIHKNSLAIDKQAIVVERRYTDFLELYNALRQGYPRLTAKISFPRKLLLGNFSPAVIKARVLSLQSFLKTIEENNSLLDSIAFKNFLIGHDDKLAKKFLEGKNYSQAKPLLEKNFKILNKILTERHPAVIVALCRLAACCSADTASLEDATKYAELALRRFDGICDVDLLYYYVPLLQMCTHLWRTLGKDREMLETKLSSLKRLGHKVDGCPSLLESMLAAE